jgi:PLP dependent protein
MIDEQMVADRLASIRERIDRHGRPGVRLIAVTKGFGVDAVVAAVRGGCSDIGENYAQELVTKMAELSSNVPRPVVHFIGRLQSNKVRMVAPIVDLWHTVDRGGLVEEIGRRAPAARVLLQVNLTEEPDKGGCRPEDLEDLLGSARRRGLDPVGLMTVGPTDGDPVVTRRAFARCANLAHDLGLAEISMGMSGDLDIALDEGATIVRVGSAIFGDRPPAR